MFYYMGREIDSLSRVEEALAESLGIVKAKSKVGCLAREELVEECLRYLANHLDEVDLESKHLLKNSLMLYKSFANSPSKKYIYSYFKEKFNTEKVFLKKKINVNNLTNN